MSVGRVEVRFYCGKYNRGSICSLDWNVGYIVNFENNIGHVYEVKDLDGKKKLEYCFYV